MEYTLQDAFQTLKDAERDRQREIENLATTIANNGVESFDHNTTQQDVRRKQQRTYQCLLDEILREEPRDYPIPTTSDLHMQALLEMKEEVQKMEQLGGAMEDRLSAIESDIAYLKRKKQGLQDMQQAYLDATKTLESGSYVKEVAASKRIFQDVKKDLYLVVDTLFPDNEGFKELLAALSSAYTKGGDDLYVDVTPDDEDYVSFLIEADIATYHRHDKTKIRFTDML